MEEQTSPDKKSKETKSQKFQPISQAQSVNQSQDAILTQMMEMKEQMKAQKKDMEENMEQKMNTQKIYMKERMQKKMKALKEDMNKKHNQEMQEMKNEQQVMENELQAIKENHSQFVKNTKIKENEIDNTQQKQQILFNECKQELKDIKKITRTACYNFLGFDLVSACEQEITEKVFKKQWEHDTLYQLYTKQSQQIEQSQMEKRWNTFIEQYNKKNECKLVENKLNILFTKIQKVKEFRVNSAHFNPDELAHETLEQVCQPKSDEEYKQSLEELYKIWAFQSSIENPDNTQKSLYSEMYQLYLALKSYKLQQQ
eukprot:TRINITY_DN362_c0_g1_i7.p1 TRINITY_DN362_c0_g1~~TRINITY_DN362_c0_g1_i7.p1  ORF type:complete len:314 (-),score=60.81 TRINITY_DN362_c0_g1_i7:417-1358(-)